MVKIKLDIKGISWYIETTLETDTVPAVGDIIIVDKDCFIYGGALTLELEAYLTDRIALLVNARERALFGSDIGKFHTQVSLGVKFIIN